MPRIRSLRPGFWSDLTICSLPRDVRATLVGLLGFSDDEGRAIEEMRLLKAFIWPLDDDITLAVLGLHLDTLEHAEQVVRWTGPDGRRYLAIPGWLDPASPVGQRVDKPAPSALPPPPPTLLPERYRNGLGLISDQSGRKGREGKGKERKGRESPTEAKKPASFGDEDARRAPAVVGSTEYERLRAGMRPEDQPALEGYTRGARNPAAFLRMLAGIPEGLYGTVFNLETVGRALTQMAGNGDPLNGKLLAGYCRSILEGPPPARRATDADEAGIERSKRWAAQKDAERAAREPAHAR